MTPRLLFLILLSTSLTTTGCQNEQKSPEYDRGVKLLAQLSLDEDADYLAPELDAVLEQLKKVPPSAREEHEQAQLLILKITSTRNRVARTKAKEAAAIMMKQRKEELEELDNARRAAAYETKNQKRLRRLKCGGKYHNDGTGECVRGRECAKDFVFKDGKCWLGI